LNFLISFISQVDRTESELTTLQAERSDLAAALASAQTDLQSTKEKSEAQIEALRVERAFLKVCPSSPQATFIPQNVLCGFAWFPAMLNAV
jgi:chromosome segregation ATPase